MSWPSGPQDSWPDTMMHSCDLILGERAQGNCSRGIVITVRLSAQVPAVRNRLPKILCLEHSVSMRSSLSGVRETGELIPSLSFSCVTLYMSPSLSLPSLLDKMEIIIDGYLLGCVSKEVILVKYLRSALHRVFIKE